MSDDSSSTKKKMSVADVVESLVETMSDNQLLGIERLIDHTYLLHEAVLDMQEFMLENGLTEQQFVDWKQKKELRAYH